MKYDINDKIFKLTIIENLEPIEKFNRKLRYIRCKCDCGNTCDILAQSFKRTISCGCHANENFLNKTNCKPGDIFGKLKVINNIKTLPGKHRYVECQCSCGTIKKVRTDLLLIKAIKSCGCLYNSKIPYNLSEINYYDNRKRKYYIGKVIGMLTIKNLNKTKAICICECGNTREVSIYNLNKIFPSCRKCYFKSKFDPNKIWKLEYSEYIKSAKKRNLDFNLTLEQFINFIQLNCYYCNAVPNGTTHSKYLKRNGIDRLDNNKHYEFSNCVPCCAMCNAAKSNKTLPDFLNWINRIHSNFYKNIESKF